MKMLKSLLAHPLTRHLAIDDPRTTHLRQRIIREKPFLRRIYEEWYDGIAAALPQGSGPVLELGAGAGFLQQRVPGLLRSELFVCPDLDVVLDGQSLPFAGNTLRAIVMVDVLHHLPEARRFFAEAARCVRPGGTVIMMEPWKTGWSEVIYRRFHHEPFEPEAARWEFPSSGPLSGANGALPWILFERDRSIFEREFPMWQILHIDPGTPFRYLVSGGVGLRSLMPGWSFPLWTAAEHAMQPWMTSWAMFARIVLRRREPGSA